VSKRAAGGRQAEQAAAERAAEAARFATVSLLLEHI
jgi:hypothetical protein